jgi:hypothetical protein
MPISLCASATATATVGDAGGGQPPGRTPRRRLPPGGAACDTLRTLCRRRARAGSRGPTGARPDRVPQRISQKGLSVRPPPRPQPRRRFARSPARAPAVQTAKPVCPPSTRSVLVNGADDRRRRPAAPVRRPGTGALRLDATKALGGATPQPCSRLGRRPAGTLPRLPAKPTTFSSRRHRDSVAPPRGGAVLRLGAS